MINGLSLFANVGIAETYLEEAGIKIILANELLEERAEFYRYVYPECEMVQGDITNPDLFEYIVMRAKKKNVEFIMATPPCQGMSLAGSKDENDPRNYLIISAVEAVQRIKPKYVLFENVTMQLQTHQIQAALFAFKSPLDKGVILADEVGLGKTIEAGIVIAQLKYESNAKVLIIAPAALMRQWANELEEKFGLSSIVMDRKQYNYIRKNGLLNPFDYDTDVIICSYQMCGSFKDDILLSGINLVVIDEAHKLRNVHNEKSITANNVKSAIANKKKILLTATPIQNNLMDLYGLASVIDENIFGDKSAFRYSYIKNFNEYEDELQIRLQQVMHRTLRQQVSHYINFTNRIPKTFGFEETKEEQEVYDLVRMLIQNSDEESYLIPAQQRHLVVLILCKLLGSSTAAIISTLTTMRNRLTNMKETGVFEYVDTDKFEEDEEELDEESELNNDEKKIDIEKLNNEIYELEEIISKAKKVKEDSKYSALKEALSYSFEHLNKLGAEEKVIIFTESRKTQRYLYDALIKDGYKGILLFNGSNNDEVSQNIYKNWIEAHEDSDAIKNSKSINMREAILEEFRKNSKILIATEAGAECHNGGWNSY